MTILGKHVDNEVAKRAGATVIGGILLSFFLWVATQVHGAQNAKQVDARIELKVGATLDDIRDRTVRIENILLEGTP